MDTSEDEQAETPRGRQLTLSSPRENAAHGLHIPLPPTSESGHLQVGLSTSLPLSTSAADALRTVYFPESPRPSRPGPSHRSASNPPPADYLNAPHSYHSRLGDVSETETTSNTGSNIGRHKTLAFGEGRQRSRKRKKMDRGGSGKVMTRGEEEIAPEWTVFGELFQGQHGALISKHGSHRERERESRRNDAATATVSTTSASGAEDGEPSGVASGSGVGRTTSSVVRQWKNVIAASRSPKPAVDKSLLEAGSSTLASGSTTQPVDISRSRSIRTAGTNDVGSPTRNFTFSPQTDAPLRHVLDGVEDDLGHHRLSTDYGRRSTSSGQRGKRGQSKSSSSEGSSSDSDSDDAPTPSPSSRRSRLSTLLSSWKSELPVLSTLHRNMLKCAIAYFLASLFTFVPYLASFIADISTFGKSGGVPSPSAHMIATISVYFNPAKTAGGMFEADLYCIAGIAFATIVTLGTNVSFWFIDNEPNLEWIGDVYIFCWLALAMMIVAWTKIWINKASYSTATSMMSIIMFIVIVKEGGLETLLQVAVNVAVGASIANVICFTLWPQSAIINLQRDMITSLDSYATLLDMLTSTFLLDPRSKGRTQLMRAVEAHQAGFTSLKRNLDEARSEWVFDHPDAPGRKGEKMSELYGDAVDSLNRLAQHLAGLRSGTKLQRDLAAAYGGKLKELRNKKSREMNTGGDGREANTEDDPFTDGKSPVNEMTEEETAAQIAAAVFGDLIEDIGPVMVALADACTGTLKRMRKVLIQDRQSIKDRSSWFSHTTHEDGHDFAQLSASIRRSLFQFDSTSNHALMRLYRRTAETDVLNSPPSADGVRDNSETMFLVYFFIFTLQEFAQELVSLVEIMGQLHEAQVASLRYRNFGGWFRRVFNIGSRKRKVSSTNDYGATSTGRASFKSLRPVIQRRFSNLVPIEPQHSPRSAFPKIRAHAPNTTQTPSRSSLSTMGRIKHRIWSALNKFKNSDIRYAFKVGVSTAILAAPAFIDATRPIFIEYRGEWALISFFVVMGQTTGATNFLAVHRICGTLFGAGTAVVAFVCLSNYPVLLALFGFFFSLPCFYYIVGKPEYATTGRFVLLSYNLTALYCYNARSQHLSIYEIAIHRSIAVTTGVLWAVIISRFWWPSEARRELAVGLSEFLLNIGWLYNRLVLTYSVPSETLSRMTMDQSGVQIPVLGATAALVDGFSNGPDERTGLLGAALTTGINTNIKHFMSMELHLQIKLIYLQKLLSQAQYEPRLKGPFPIQLYRSILTSLQCILDLLHSMRCVTTREEWYTSVRREFIVPVNKERREMVGNVILYFSVLSSAFQLKKPLPPYLPPAERSRQRLVAALKDLDIVKQRRVSSSRQLLYFAYALMMRGVIAELEILGKTLQEAFGVIGQNTHDFEALFIDNGEESENYP